MNLLKKNILLPKPLWRLHGKEPPVIDILFTYLFALVVSINNFLVFQIDSIWKTVAVIILSFDIAGGVISNFSQSTVSYYRNHSKDSASFIWTHTFHAGILLWIFPEQRIEIASLAAFILVSAYLVSRIKIHNLQKILSIFFFCCVMVVIVTWLDLPAPLSILLLLFSFKLTIAFAGKWR